MLSFSVDTVGLKEGIQLRSLANNMSQLYATYITMDNVHFTVLSHSTLISYP